MSEQLLQTVLKHSGSKNSRLHGQVHWAGVAAAGFTLCELTPEADRGIVLLFSMLHDSMRVNDGHDQDHGKRAAALAQLLRESKDLDLDDKRFAVLQEALVYHDKGQTSTDPTIGACWDADRLNLWRIGRRPNSALLSTPAARRLPDNSARVFSGLAFNWQAIFASYEADSSKTVYLRFGELPAGEFSAVPFLGWHECGISVYPGIKLDCGAYALDFRQCLLGIDTRFLLWLLQQARPLYLVGGRPVGVGGMGEPLLEGARIVKEVPASSVGKDPGPLAFMGAKEPDERPLFPFAAAGGVGMSGFWSTVESQKRELLRGWGLLEDYDRANAATNRRK
jgi:uncharacterized protein